MKLKYSKLISSHTRLFQCLHASGSYLEACLQQWWLQQPSFSWPVHTKKKTLKPYHTFMPVPLNVCVCPFQSQSLSRAKGWGVNRWQWGAEGGPGENMLAAQFELQRNFVTLVTLSKNPWIKLTPLPASIWTPAGDQPRPELRLYLFIHARTCILTDHTYTPVIHAAVFPFLLAGYPPVECQSTVFSSPASWQLVRGRAALGSLLSSLGSGEDRLTGWHMLDPTSTRHYGALCLSAWLGVHQSSRRSHHLPLLWVWNGGSCRSKHPF